MSAAERIHRTPRQHAEWLPATPGVYFVQAGVGGLIKIGCATRIRSRVAELRRMNGVELTVLGYIERCLARANEALIHRRFAHLRRHGEWFAPAEELRAFIAVRATRPT